MRILAITVLISALLAPTTEAQARFMCKDIFSLFSKRQSERPDYSASKTKLKWLDVSIETNVSEYRSLFAMNRANMLESLQRYHDIQPIFLGREFSIKEFFKSPGSLFSWPVVSVFFKTPSSKRAEVKEAYRFYGTKVGLEFAEALYVNPRGLLEDSKHNIYHPSQRPMGNSPIIALRENFSKEVLLHEFTHHLIGEAIHKKEGSVNSRPRRDELIEQVQSYAKAQQTATTKLTHQKAALNKHRVTIEALKASYFEEFAINNFLLDHRVEIGLTKKATRNILKFFLKDVELASDYISSVRSELGYLESTFNEAGLKESKEILAMYNQLAKKFSQGAETLFETNPELRSLVD